MTYHVDKHYLLLINWMHLSLQQGQHQGTISTLSPCAMIILLYWCYLKSTEQGVWLPQMLEDVTRRATVIWTPLVVIAMPLLWIFSQIINIQLIIDTFSMHIVSHITLLSTVGSTISYVTCAIIASVYIPCSIEANDTITFAKTTSTAGLFRFLK